MKSRLTTELSDQIRKVVRLSLPAIVTQIAAVAMQYIDSAMVGKLGADASAAIGLVSSSTWLIDGLGTSLAAGFSVQIAQYIGAGRADEARRVEKHGLVAALLMSLLMMLFGMGISGSLPQWLGADRVLWKDASAYFFVFSASLPFLQMVWLTSACLQCSGNMIVPSVLNAVMCGLDVLFNSYFIPRYGVLGAALGTALSVAVVSLILLCYCCLISSSLRINRKEPCKWEFAIWKRALKIAAPLAAEQAATCGAMVATTRITAPLGSVAIAANSFAITAEGLCFMSGYGIASAATAMVGQSIGAADYRGARRMGYITVIMGGGLMGLAGLAMMGFCPWVFRFLTPDPQVQQVATQILRIGLLAEALFGVSIVASGALRGAEDTLVPSILNLLSIWVVRIGLALLLVKPFGIHGVWVAMTVELCVRGLVMLWRLGRSPYLKERA